LALVLAKRVQEKTNITDNKKMCQAVLGQAADLCTKELMKDEHFGIGSLEGLTQWVLLVHTYGTVGQGMASQFLILQNYFRYPDAVMF